MGMVLWKPKPELVATITAVFMNTAYDTVTGWAGSDAGAFKGSLGTAGILTHYYSAVEPNKLTILDCYTYGNDHSGDCLDKPTEDVTVAKMSTCGQPWTCPDLLGLSPAERTQCGAFQKFWFEMRKDFEDNCWIGGPTTSRDGTFQSEVSLGFCNGPGIINYNRLITDQPAPFSCDPHIQTNSVTNKLAYGSGRFQAQKLTLTTGKVTGQPEVCISGTVLKAGFEPPYNICIVIDVSASTGGAFGGTPPGDVNGDVSFSIGQEYISALSLSLRSAQLTHFKKILQEFKNTILDAEIGSIIAVLEHIAASEDLNNENVNIGLVTFSTAANYLGLYLPLDPNDGSKVNPTLRSALTGLRSGGSSSFDNALDKSIEFFNEAPDNRSQLMFFLSDGVPNVPDDGDSEEQINTMSNNHPSALTYSSELAILDNFGVSRIAIGVGSGSDIRDGFGLALIDNTPDDITNKGAQQVTTTDTLTNILLSNPVVGQVVAFEVMVNDVVDPNFGISDVVPGPVGFTYGQLIVSGLNPFFGAVNKVKVKITLDFDGDVETTADQNSLYTENVIPGAMPGATQFMEV